MNPLGLQVRKYVSTTGSTDFSPPPRKPMALAGEPMTMATEETKQQNLADKATDKENVVWKNHYNDNSKSYRKLHLNIKNFLQRFEKEQKIDAKTDPVKLFGFNCHLQAITQEKGFLRVYLRAEPLDLDDNRMEIDCRFFISKNFAGKDSEEYMSGMVCENDKAHCTGWDFLEMAKLEDLLDEKKGFLTPDGDIKIWAYITPLHRSI